MANTHAPDHDRDDHDASVQDNPRMGARIHMPACIPQQKDMRGLHAD